MLDHLSGGRLNFGVAASGLPSDWQMFNVDGMSGQNRGMTREALEIILRMWGPEETFEHRGKYWSVDKPATMFGFLKPHIKPLQQRSEEHTSELQSLMRISYAVFCLKKKKKKTHKKNKNQ